MQGHFAGKAMNPSFRSNAEKLSFSAFAAKTVALSKDGYRSSLSWGSASSNSAVSRGCGVEAKGSTTVTPPQVNPC